MPRSIKRKIISAAESVFPDLFVAVKSGDVVALKKIIENSQDLDINCASENGVTILYSAVARGNIEITTELLKHGANPNQSINYGITPLHDTAYRDDAPMAMLLLQYGALPDQRNFNGETPLHYATKQKSLKVANVLIEAGAQVHIGTFSEKAEPIHFSSQYGDVEMLKLLLKKVSNIDCVANGRRSSLHFAAFFGHEEAARILIENGANVDLKSAGGITALHLAAKEGNTNVVRLLLRYGSLVDGLDEDMVTALMLAAQNGHSYTAKVLLNGGADLNREDKIGMNSICLATQNAHEDVVSLLISYGARVVTSKKLSALHISANLGNVDIIKLLLNYNTEIDAPDGNGYTPLHYATQSYNIAAILTLLDRGANVNALSNNETSALDMACQNGKEDLANIFVLHKSNLNRCNGMNGMSPLHAAIVNGLGLTVSLLLKNGADPNLSDNNNVKPLYIAVKYAHENIVRYLLNAGATPNWTDENGISALHIASAAGFYNIASLLLISGADVDAKDHYYVTPIHRACIKEHSNIVELLISYGANVNALTTNGISPIHFVSNKPGCKAAEMLLDADAKVDLHDGFDKISTKYLARKLFLDQKLNIIEESFLVSSRFATDIAVSYVDTLKTLVISTSNVIREISGHFLFVENISAKIKFFDTPGLLENVIKFLKVTEDKKLIAQHEEIQESFFNYLYGIGYDLDKDLGHYDESLIQSLATHFSCDKNTIRTLVGNLINDIEIVKCISDFSGVCFRIHYMYHDDLIIHSKYSSCVNFENEKRMLFTDGSYFALIEQNSKEDPIQETSGSSDKNVINAGSMESLAGDILDV